MLCGDLMTRQFLHHVGEGCEEFCYLSKILDDLAVVTNKAKECAYLFSIFGGFH